MAYIKVEAADENGDIIPDSDMQIEFEINGDGDLIAAGNGNPYRMECFQDNQCSLFHGKAVVIVRPKNNGEKNNSNRKGQMIKTCFCLNSGK